MVFQFILLVVPPLLLVTTYLFTTFPHPPEPIPIHPSLASLPKESSSWTVYPEDLFGGGAYASLPYGRVRYWVLGPETGRKVVLIHGLSIPSVVWKDMAPDLASRGYRVLVYDLYGRGYSDAPYVTYDASLFTIQLALLMQHIRWEKADIVGVSMGGGVAGAFTAQFPHLTDKVVLIASAGLIETQDMSRTVKLMSSPLVHWLTSSYIFRRYLRHLADKQSTTPTNPIQEVVRIQSAYLPGYNWAIASSLREGPIRGLASAFGSKGFEGREVLIVHGTEDDSVPFKYALQIQSLLPSNALTTLVTIKGGKHDMTMEKPEEINDTLVQFLG